MECKICGRQCKNYNSLAQHIKGHKISSKEYYDKYLSPSTEHVCKYCGKKVSKFLNINVGYATTCGIDCIRHNAFKHIDKEKANKKAAETKLKRYGSATYNNTKKRKSTIANYSEEKKSAIIEKRRNTCKAKYGVNAPMQSEKVRKTWSDNYFKKTGYQHQCQNPAVRKKIKETTLSRYGYDNCRKNPDIKNKIKQTKIALYGNTNNIEKTRETNLKRYGATCCWSNPNIRAKCFRRYEYEGIPFDSSWELAFYIYNKDSGKDIVRNSTVFFTFTLDNVTHRCFPDFQVEDTLYEIKGDQFVDQNTTKWIDPFNTNNNNFYEKKHQCLLKNNVIILYEKDVKKYFDYIDQKYGKNYLAQFRKTSNKGAHNEC